MPEQPTGADSGTSTQTGVEEAPTDFREYVKWRTTGELPQKNQSAAAEVQEPEPAKTDPDSETEPQEPEEPEDDDQETESERRRRSGSRNRRIDRLTREIEDLRRQLATETPPPPAKPPQPPQPEGKPKLEQFQTLEAYQEALTDWKLDQREQINKARTEIENTQKAWAEKEKAAMTSHPDFAELTESVEVPNTIAIQAARMAMLEDDHGAEILYWLARHPDEVKRIAALSPVSAVREIGRIGAQISSTSAPSTTTRSVTGAPKPPPSITRPSRTTPDSIYDEEVARDWPRWMKAREASMKR